jgi:hypothetical protein
MIREAASWDEIELPVSYIPTPFSPMEGGGDEPIDPGILGWVNLLRFHGIETCQSCEGGIGHAYPEPTIEFYGNRYIGWWAASVAMMAGEFDGLRAYSLSRRWHLSDGEPQQPVWALTLIGQTTHPWWPKGTKHHAAATPSKSDTTPMPGVEE